MKPEEYYSLQELRTMRTNALAMGYRNQSYTVRTLDWAILSRISGELLDDVQTSMEDVARRQADWVNQASTPAERQRRKWLMFPHRYGGSFPKENS